MSDSRRPTSPIPSRLLVFLPALLILTVSCVALRLDRESWHREQTDNAAAALARVQSRFWERLPQQPEAVRMASGNDGTPAWKILTFPDVPEPQAGKSPLTDILEQGDAETVWGQGSGQLSAAGIPLRLLALRNLALKSPAMNADVLNSRLSDIIRSEPSSLIPVVLDEIELSQETNGVRNTAPVLRATRREWTDLMIWRALYLRNGMALTSTAKPQWFAITQEGVSRRLLVNGHAPWLALEESAVKSLLADLAKDEALLPFGVRLEDAAGNPAGEVIVESSALPEMCAIVYDAAAFSAAAWKRTAWLSGFAALAVAGTLWGSRQMLRALRRQGELSRHKSNFIASVSHELRTPLTSLRVLSENLKAGRVGESEMRSSYFPLMVDECRRLGALVENVLEFARAEGGGSRFQFAETDVTAMIADTVKLVHPKAEQSGLQMETVLPPLPEPVASDAMSLHRALLNLLDNAIKFTPPGGHITLTLRHEKPGWWSLSVQDTGPGIRREEHTRIFERFYRSGSELTRAVPGTGIGLSIVQHIAEGHGGRVSLTSAPGSGAVFTLHLPYQPPQTRSQQS